MAADKNVACSRVCTQKAVEQDDHVKTLLESKRFSKTKLSRDFGIQTLGTEGGFFPALEIFSRMSCENSHPAVTLSMRIS